MMRPPSPMWRDASCTATKTARTFTATMRSKSSSENRSSGATTAIPALLTSTSRPPSVRTVSATAFFYRHGVAAVGADSHGAPACRLDGAHHFVGLLLRAGVGDGDGSTVKCEPPRDGRADPARSTRGQCDLACEFLRHCPAPPADPGRLLCIVRYIMRAWTWAVKGFSIDWYESEETARTDRTSASLRRR